MRHCPFCLVIVRETDERCPLCGKPTLEGELQRLETQHIPGTAEYPTFRSGKQRDTEERESSDMRINSKIAVELISVFSGIALVVTILANLFAEHKVSWSLYAGIGILMLWLVICIPLILRKYPWLIFAVLGPSMPLLIFVLDVLDGHITWYLCYGLPITLLVELCITLASLFIGISQRKGLNVFAILLLAVTVFCLGLETIIDVNLMHRLTLDWSVIVSFACVPMAGLLFYLHYRIMQKASLKKLFRL
ncbi:DUF6320 domain-containing protein [Gracilinema caldarium]|uniref:Uncharacterized protein n=1 Tax=Gracilinema caldarium (strain ATCC 51460 / DSM 7334 / H1) TaxID=744872 RepID=F8F452_GRAC1|nr:DUF6320 domain-containing protein [Gracilinema caldarium]AEJ20071.1 hypothetical protein Spica_1942 [Gracilinema caldarium DSM 7334]